MMVGVENKAAAGIQAGVQRQEPRSPGRLVLAYSAPDVQTDQVGIDRQIGVEFTRQLDALCKANKEKVKIVPFHKVEKFKNDNPSWKTMGGDEIGRKFDADYVIDVEIVAMSLYKPGSRKTLFEGACKLERLRPRPAQAAGRPGLAPADRRSRTRAAAGRSRSATTTPTASARCSSGGSRPICAGSSRATRRTKAISAIESR